MHLQSLSLEHFRSYADLALTFGAPGIELLLGGNGSGKTNILESIAFLSQLSSFRGIASEHLIEWHRDYFRIRAALGAAGGEMRTLECVTERAPAQRRAQFVNDVRVAQAAFLGIVPTVTFLPEDLDIFTGGPDRRRWFVDELIAQVTPEFRGVRAEYAQVLRQRNALLKRVAAGQARQAEIEVWDEQLASHGAALQRARLSMLERIGASLEPVLRSLQSSWRSVELCYLRRTESREGAALASELLTLLSANRARDVLIGTTTVGPHRDDWRLLSAGRDVALFASRGEQRAGLLALLLRAIDIVRSQRSDTPVVLLDDVFSELDEAHQLALLESVAGCQAFLTATHLPHSLRGHYSVWDVERGKVLHRR